MNDVVSIIFTSRDLDRFMRRCLDSLVNQTYPYLEILAVDDGSTDKTVDIIKEYEAKDKRVKYVVSNSANKQKAINLGMQNATGKYLMIMDGDDDLPLDTIERLLEGFTDGVEAVFGATVQIFPDGKRIVYAPKEGVHDVTTPEGLRAFLEYVDGGEFLSKGLILREKTTANYEIGVHLWDHNLFYLKVLKDCHKFRFISSIVYNYYYMQSATSTMALLMRNSIFEQSKPAYRSFMKLAKEMYDDDDRIFDVGSILIVCLCADVRYLMSGGDIKERVAEELNCEEIKEIFSYFKPKNKLENEFKNAFLSGNVDNVVDFLNKYKNNKELPFCINASAIQDVVERSFNLVK